MPTRITQAALTIWLEADPPSSRLPASQGGDLRITCSNASMVPMNCDVKALGSANPSVAQPAFGIGLAAPLTIAVPGRPYNYTASTSAVVVSTVGCWIPAGQRGATLLNADVDLRNPLRLGTVRPADRVQVL